MSFDATSYIIGKEDGEGKVIFEEGAEYTFSDPNNDGHIVIKKKEAE